MRPRAGAVDPGLLVAVGPISHIVCPGRGCFTYSDDPRAGSLRLAVRLGFQPVSIFTELDAEQTLAQASLHSFKA